VYKVSVLYNKSAQVCEMYIEGKKIGTARDMPSPNFNFRRSQVAKRGPG